jgi:prepilin-type N-terminal cleavage/methylation domain-containing protein
MSANRDSSDGFTIVEILVAMAVAAVIIISLNAVTNTYLHISQKGRYLNLANSFAEAKTEQLRNKGYNALTTGTTSLTSSLPSGLPPGSTATMTVTSPSGGIKQVDISISYKDTGKTLTYGYTTYLGELGVGQ